MALQQEDLLFLQRKHIEDMKEANTKLKMMFNIVTPDEDKENVRRVPDKQRAEGKLLMSMEVDQLQTLKDHNLRLKSVLMKRRGYAIDAEDEASDEYFTAEDDSDHGRGLNVSSQAVGSPATPKKKTKPTRRSFRGASSRHQSASYGNYDSSNEEGEDLYRPVKPRRSKRTKSSLSPPLYNFDWSSSSNDDTTEIQSPAPKLEDEKNIKQETKPEIGQDEDKKPKSE